MRIARTTAALAGAVLIGSHGWLLASQVADGRLAEPWLLARWIVAAGLVGGLVALRRSGASLWSHKAAAIWVLAALLHGPAVAADVSQTLNGPALPEVIATVVVQVASASGLIAFGLWLLVGLLARAGRRTPSLRWLLLAAATSLGRPAVHVAAPFAPRPPPLA